ncbi:BREX-1 system adenine-specific DNA-methyltransferase PglX, partial [Roseovarius sp. D22-M7]|uniref:BREX-1 system adenine-specific DNA-methyltransferase PglX n=1 Tax=Roseovarius sp. D22-M7 TaxID=3127116 RepID=UPI00300FFC59
MDTNALKKFAAAARNLLIDQVTAKLDLVLAEGAPARREHLRPVKDLENAIKKDGRKQIIEQVAYTWFNRFTALRFMDAGGYTQVRVVSPADGATRPEILTEALAGNIPEGAPGEIAALLENRTPSNDPQAEAYRLLLVHACNGWHKHMPFLFEKIDDYSELLMPEDLLSQSSILAELRKVMTEDACQDVEIIGWLYQFYISEKKDQVFAGLKKNQKITAENIPAATQLFTPHWIVRYLVENSLGRLWLLNRPDSRLAERMDYYIAPEEPETDFLKIGKPEEIKVCDPACGSGHMLTFAFDLLHAIYEEEGYEATEIPALILTHNLTGVEIDDRAGALAGFALAMKAAARLGRRRFLRMEAKPDICVLQNVAFTAEDVRDVAAVVGKDLFTDELRETLGQFEQAKNFGSLIVPKLRDPAETLRVVEARDFGGDLLLKEVQARVVAVLRMAESLSPKYHVVVANPPYMGKRSMNDRLKSFVERNYPAGKADLFAVCMEAFAALTLGRSYLSMINMQSWMFLSSFSDLRDHFIRSGSFVSMAHLGERAFDTIGGSVVSTTAFVWKTGGDLKRKGEFLRLVEARNESEKSKRLREASQLDLIYRVSSKGLALIPGSPLAYWATDGQIKSFLSEENFGDIASPKVGMQTADNEKFLRLWHEVVFQETSCFRSDQMNWIAYSKGGTYRKWYGNNDYVLHFRTDGRELKKQKNATLPDLSVYSANRCTWTDIGGGSPFGARQAPLFSFYDIKGHSFFPAERANGVLSCANSKPFNRLLKKSGEKNIFPIIRVSARRFAGDGPRLG